MKIAIMQPYILPYLGYWQLIVAVDKFIVYNDVNFIKQGWINRNNILVNGRPFRFTVPIKQLSSYVKINEVQLASGPAMVEWRNKFDKTIEMAYLKAPFYYQGVEILKKILRTNLAPDKFWSNAIKVVVEYLEIPTEIVPSSTLYGNSYIKSKERVIDICKREKADTYINLSGGMSLYGKEEFAAEGINLQFIKAKPVSYRQFNNEFVPNLSILDVIMFNDVKTIRKMLNEYILL